MEVFEYNSSVTSGNNSIPHNQHAVILGALNIVFVIVGIPGNVLVIVAVLLSKKLQNVSTAFIANLAIADLMTCTVMPIFTVAQFVNFYSPALEPMCTVAVSVVHTCIGGSIFSLAAIAFNRLMVLAASKRFYKLSNFPIFRPKVIAVSIAILWSLSLSIAILPPFAFDVGRLGFDFATHTCAAVVGYPGTDIYKNILVYGFYPIPLTVIVLSYVGILVQLIAHNRRLTQSGVNSAHNSNSDGTETGNPVSGRKENQFTRLEIQITKNMFFVFVAYIICLTPQAACTKFTCGIDENYTRFLVAFNSILNPLIYGLNHPLFRAVFVGIFTCKPIPEPSPFWINLKRRMNLSY